MPIILGGVAAAVLYVVVMVLINDSTCFDLANTTETPLPVKLLFQFLALCWLG